MEKRDKISKLGIIINIVKRIGRKEDKVMQLEMNHQLEDLKINFIIFSVLIFSALFLCAFADFYACSISGLYRPVGYIVMNYLIPILMVHFGAIWGVHERIEYFALPVLATFWFIFLTVMHAEYAYRLPF